MKKIYFIRHGEAEGNVTRTTQNLDTPLTDKGQEQAKVIADRVAKLEPEVLLVSPYLRTRQTAEPITIATKLPVNIVDSVHEIRPPSSFVGVHHDDERRKMYVEALIANRADQDWRYEDEESFNDILERCRSTYTMLQARTEESIVVVSHGGFIKYFTAYVLLQEQLTSELFGVMFFGMGFVDNTSVTHFIQNDDNTLALEIYNDIAHFAE